MSKNFTALPARTGRAILCSRLAHEPPRVQEFVTIHEA